MKGIPKGYWGKLLYSGMILHLEYPIGIGRGVFCALMSMDSKLTDELRGTEYDISDENDINSPKFKKLKSLLEEKYGH